MADLPSPEIRVEARDADALFEDGPGVSPHPEKVVTSDLAEHLGLAARERRKVPSLSITIVLASGPLPAGREESIRTDLHHFFADEADRSQLNGRVNRTEGWGSFRYAVPFLALFGVLSYALYSLVLPNFQFLITLIYLVAISVVWVMLWDPIEKLIFSGYLIDVETAAYRKLATAPVRFEARSGSGASGQPVPGPAPTPAPRPRDAGAPVA